MKTSWILGFLAMATLVHATEPRIYLQPLTPVLQNPPGDYFTEYYARANHTYFLQHSPDAVDWFWLPIIRAGNNALATDLFSSSHSPLLLRLIVVERSSVTPGSEDFDADGISNLAEILAGTNPLGSGTFSLYPGSSPLPPTPTNPASPQAPPPPAGDGWTTYGLDPLGRIHNTAAPTLSESFDYDAEGNLEKL